MSGIGGLPVHNHGPREGRGLDCGEGLIGHCMVAQLRDESPKAEEAVRLIQEFGWIDGAHHKDWVLDQVHLALTGEHVSDDEDEWGIAP